MLDKRESQLFREFLKTTILLLISISFGLFISDIIEKEPKIKIVKIKEPSKIEYKENTFLIKEYYRIRFKTKNIPLDTIFVNSTIEKIK